MLAGLGEFALVPTALRVPPLLHGGIFVVVFWCTAVALGRCVLRLSRGKLEACTTLERALLCAAIGAGCLQYLPLGLGVFGLLGVGSLSAAFGIVVLVLAFDTWRHRRAPGLLWSEVRDLVGSTPNTIWWLQLLVLMVILLVRAAGLGDTGDDDGYHLAAPKRWLELGSVAYLPTYTHTNTSLGFEMLYAIALAVCGPVGAKLLHYSAGILCLLGLLLCARRTIGVAAGAVAISLLLIATPVCDLPSLFQLAYVDLGASLMGLAAVLSWFVWREAPSRGLLGCAAVCAGFAGSFKFTGLALAIAFIPMIAVELASRGRRPVAIFQVLAGFAIVSGLPVLPWLIRSWFATGNPLYPVLSSLIPTRDWSAAQATVFSNYIHYYSWGIASGARLSLADRQSIVAVTALVILVGATVLLRFTRAATLRQLIILAGTYSLISVALTGLLVRYFLPAFILLSLVVAGHIVHRRIRWDLIAVPTMACALFVEIGQKNSEFATNVGMASGVTPVSKARADSPFWRTWTYLNDRTPRDARVLMAAFYTSFGLSSAGAFWVDRTCFTTDSHLQSFIDLNDWPAFLRSIQRAGISHMVIVDRQTSAGRHGFDFLAGRNEYPFTRRLADEHGEKLAQYGKLQIYRIVNSSLPRRVAAQQ